MKIDKREAAVDALLSNRVAQVVEHDELRRLLLAGDRPLRVKFGVDPTSPDLHIGHGVPFERLRAFQDLGHLPVLVVGDTTAQIGDPSERNSTRPMLTADQVRANAETYLAQFGLIVDPERTEVRWQSEWFGRFGLGDVFKLLSDFTLARIIERDTFAKRLKDGIPISMHETLYPLLQAYDSVAVQADVELGGTDQTFNLLVGRDLLRDHGQAPQQIMTVELLVGTDGVQKMSKSLGNAIGLTDAPYEQYAKTMSIPDELMDNWAHLVTRWTNAEADSLVAALSAGEIHPKAAKQRLAREIVSRWHGEGAAESAAEEWERAIGRGEGITDIATIDLAAPDGQLSLIQIMTMSGLAGSNTQVRNLVRQGGVRLNGEVVASPDIPTFAPGDQPEIRVGKRVGKRIRVTK
ncbi:MAG TPA: tyrosine--tRNA ligase [Candidatus Limnocylindria bacterium]